LETSVEDLGLSKIFEGSNRVDSGNYGRQIVTVANNTSNDCIFELIARRDAAMGGAAFASFSIRRLRGLTQIIFLY